MVETVSRRQKTVFLGVDPGQSGGLVALLPDGKVVCDRMPATEKDCWNWFHQWSWGELTGAHPAVAVIEDVHSMPGQGVSSSFKFGRNFGFLRGCLVAAGIPFTEVSPRVWQKGVGVVPRKKTETKTQFKNRLRGLAQQYYPSLKVTLAVSDALLIALYCRRTNS